MVFLVDYHYGMSDFIVCTNIYLSQLFHIYSWIWILLVRHILMEYNSKFCDMRPIPKESICVYLGTNDKFYILWNWKIYLQTPLRRKSVFFVGHYSHLQWEGNSYMSLSESTDNMLFGKGRVKILLSGN
jgi:hypothetical protein